MNKLLPVVAIFFLSIPGWSQQSTPRPAPVPSVSTAPSLAPLVDEKTLRISDNGASANTQGTQTSSSGDLTFWDFLRMFLILAAVIGMIIGFIYLLRRVSGQGGQSDTPVKVLYTHVLAGSRVLYLVEIGSEILLLGSGDAGVQLIKEITDQETIDAVRLAASQQKGLAKGTFGTLLGQLMGRKEKILPKIEEPVENSSDFLKKQRERLKKL